jgi:hypothetical protein
LLKRSAEISIIAETLAFMKMKAGGRTGDSEYSKHLMSSPKYFLSYPFHEFLALLVPARAPA